MDFNFEIKESDNPVTTVIGVPVSEEMKIAITEIKKKKENAKLVNDLGRQFFAQLIERYRAGGFESGSAHDLSKILK